jgi:hypothetical protein
MTSINAPAGRSVQSSFQGLHNLDCSRSLVGGRDAFVSELTNMTQSRELGPDAIDKAMLEPASVFTSPEEVLEHDELTKQQKIDILWRWQYDAAEQSVALEEGMPGNDSDLLRRIMLVLGTLGAPLDIAHTGPTKQHGLPRPVVSRDR